MTPFSRHKRKTGVSAGKGGEGYESQRTVICVYTGKVRDDIKGSRGTLYFTSGAQRLSEQPGKVPGGQAL